MKRFLTLFLPVFILSSCAEKQDKVADNLEVIHVSPYDETQKHNFYEFFDQSKLVPLETSQESLIASIDRIIYYGGKIYILDKRGNSIFIFHEDGRFANKIYTRGRGPGEYEGLADFTIDEANNRLIVNSHRPYKLLYYDLEGKFISDKTLETYYRNIGISDNQLIMVKDTYDTHELTTENLEAEEQKKYLPLSEKANIFANHRLMFPNILKSKANYITFQYTDTVYQYSNDTLKPKYRVDFGDKKMPENLYNGRLSAGEIYDEAMKNEYGFGIANFRENDNFISFTYGKNRIVLYSKETKEARTFNSLYNDKDFIYFQNHFAHDGDNNRLIGVNQAIRFKLQMNMYRKMPEKWEKIPEYIKKIDSQTDEASNPLLLVCDFHK